MHMCIYAYIYGVNLSQNNMAPLFIHVDNIHFSEMLYTQTDYTSQSSIFIFIFIFTLLFNPILLRLGGLLERVLVCL